MRRSKSIETLLPILYLKGISTGDFSEALAALLGKDAAGLSASSIGRLKDGWFDEHDAWQRRDLSAKRYVYIWLTASISKPGSKTKAVHPRVDRRDAGRPQGTGWASRWCRESAHDWRDLLLDLEAARARRAPATRYRRWSARVLESGWRGLAENARAALLGAQDRQRARQAAEEPAAESQTRVAGDMDGRNKSRRRTGVRRLHRELRLKYEKAADCLGKDRDTLLAFYDFPAEHWKHLRTTNPSKAPSPPCAIARSDRRAVCRTGPRSRWSSTGRWRTEKLAPSRRS